MNEVIRMNDTAKDLIAAASELFARHGYDGTSVRAITKGANANLGAITYHFGSKEALHDAVFDSLVGPLPGSLREAAGTEGAPLDRIERAVRALFKHLRANPTLPRLMMQQLVSARPLPRPARVTLRANVALFASLIAEGQKDGSVRPGDPTLMALSVGSQPVFLNLVREALRESAEIDQDDPTIGKEVVESVVRFIRAGLADHQSDKP
jgi:AcrR family transcriptional regulator